MLEAVERKSLSDAVFEQLRDRILGGEIAPGEKLPPERELCEMLGVNRNALREALKRLEQARLVSIRHGGATTALDYRKSAGPELLTSLLLDERGRVNTEIARGVIEMRTALGHDIARLAALRRSDADAGALGEIVRRMEHGRDDLELLRGPNKEFWDLLVRASDNLAYQLLYNTLAQITETLSSTLESLLSSEVRDVEGFRAIADAVAAGDAEAARAATQALLEQGSETLVNLLQALRQAQSSGDSATGDATAGDDR